MYFNNLKSILKCINEYNFINILQFLIKNDKKFNINILDNFSNNLLHLICRDHKLLIFEFIVQNTNIKYNIQNEDGRTPLHIAMIYSSSRELSCKRDKKQNINKHILNSNKIINYLLKLYPEALEVKDIFNKTPIDYYTIHSEIKDIKIIKNFDKIFKNYFNKNIYIEKLIIYLIRKR